MTITFCCFCLMSTFHYLAFQITQFPPEHRISHDGRFWIKQSAFTMRNKAEYTAYMIEKKNDCIKTNFFESEFKTKLDISQDLHLEKAKCNQHRNRIYWHVMILLDPDNVDNRLICPLFDKQKEWQIYFFSWETLKLHSMFTQWTAVLSSPD